MVSIRNELNVIALILVASAAMAQDRLPSDHEIFSLPKFTFLRSEFKYRLYAVGVPKPEADLVWSVTLDRKSFLLGEPITARIKVANRSSHFTYRLSYPYSGHNVATVSTWTRQAHAEPASKKATSELTEFLRIRHGNYWDDRRLRSGPPLHLPPGNSIELEICLNVHDTFMVTSNHKVPSWRAGVGTGKPGKYDIFLRYVNLDGLWMRDKALYVEQVPPKPVVMGPLTVEILPPTGIDTTKLEDQIARWEVNCEPTDSILETKVSDLQAITDALADSDVPSAAALRTSLQLSIVTHKLDRTISRDKGGLPALLKEVRRIRDSAPAGILKNAARITECYTLIALDQNNAALEIAKKIGSPDARALVAELEAKIAEKKKPSR
jgi:hypothetical protein